MKSIRSENALYDLISKKENVEKFCSLLSAEDLRSCAMVSKNFNLLFNSRAMVKSDAEKLLEYVINADYKNIADVFVDKPYLMYEHARAKDITDEMIYTSPLKYALYVEDPNIVKLFRRYSTHQSIGRFSVEEKAHLFLHHASTQTERMDYQPLIDAYDGFQRLWQEYRALCDRIPLDKEAISVIKEKILNVWNQIGAAQRMCLPRHMLHKFCYQDYSYTICVPVERYILYSPSIGSDMRLSTLLDSSKNNMVFYNDDLLPDKTLNPKTKPMALSLQKNSTYPPNFALILEANKAVFVFFMETAKELMNIQQKEWQECEAMMHIKKSR